MILFFLILAVFIWFNCYYHWYTIEVKGQYIDHKGWTIYRGIFFVVNSFIYSPDIVSVVVLSLFQSALFWIVFDIGLNLYRQLPVFYIGKSAWLDRYFAGKLELMLLVKLVYFLITLTFAVIII
jgi:hypothetical protein